MSFQADKTNMDKTYFIKTASKYLQDECFQNVVKAQDNSELSADELARVKTLATLLERVANGELEIMDSPDFYLPTKDYRGLWKNELFESWIMLRSKYRLHYGLPNLMQDYNQVKGQLKG